MQNPPVAPRLFERVRIVTIQRADYTHGAAFREYAFGLLVAFAALGARVDAADNELLTGEGVNVVFGAHLLDPGIALPPNTIVVNLEQMRAGWPAQFPHYIALMRRHVVFDYSPSNVERVRELTGNPHVHLLKPGYVPALTTIEPAGNQDVDVLFYGSLNERRHKILDGLREAGLVVQHLMGVYGAARDQWIARSKIVLNVHFYDDKIHEIVRTSWLLANHKAVVSECEPDTEIDDDVRAAIVAVPYGELVKSCVALVKDDARRREVEQRGFEIFARRDQAAMLAAVLAQVSRPVPRRINLGSGKAYDPEQLNIDIDPKWQPDILGDLANPAGLKQIFFSPSYGLTRLEAGQFDEITAMDVLEHVPDLVTFMTNCLELLRVGGAMRVGVPYDLSHGAWQDPTHVRAFNERSWLYYTEWHWYTGWTHARFNLAQLNMTLSPVGQALKTRGVPDEEIFRTPRAVDDMQAVLVKRMLTAPESERAVAWQRGALRAAPAVAAAGESANAGTPQL
ncbi:hypothetical protein [Paraburkholderia tagetis]|uniref:Methyltransferase domain-containing protein n=1 Tax=Paraburkholderia tagetis TaxID=2913261 RepID=A0A9X1UHR6_9BURK|nr:hypothetical protein [Paraburkholderia tagetis]MCG5074017.1 hypothetical protein [Paraburkholderia tagetis]